MKHSQTKLSNTVCELSKYMVEANISHYKAILNAINYLIDTKYYCYQIKLDKNINRPWEICGYSDGECARDEKTHKIVARFIVLINILVMSRHSRSQKTVTISITEYGYSVFMEV